MSLSQLRRRVDALKRKLAVSLAVVQLRPIAEEFCDEWALAVSLGNEPPPVSPKDVPASPKYINKEPPAAFAQADRAYSQSDAVNSTEALVSNDPQATSASKQNDAPTFILPRTRKARPKPLIRRVADAGFRVDTFMVLVGETDRCRANRVLPQPNEILRSLLPKAAVFGLIPASPPEIAY